MFPLGHIGLTLALVVGARRWVVDLRVDYRLLLVATLLPDLIDKPLSLAFGIGGRNIAHTLLFALTLTALFVWVRPRSVETSNRAVWSAAFLALAIGTWTHLLLDRMWELPEVLFWPFLGPGFPLDTFDPFNFLEAYRDPYVLIGDILGALVLGYLAWRHRIYRRANFMRFLRKGGLAPS
ncbi:MAG: metal-dependent hydrolase [Thermoplasmata archaeon]